MENVADTLIHGTRNRGERSGAAKLTRDKVATIRALRGVETQRLLAERFGVRRETIRDIQKRRIWAWLT